MSKITWNKLLRLGKPDYTFNQMYLNEPIDDKPHPDAKWDSKNGVWKLPNKTPH